MLEYSKRKNTSKRERKFEMFSQLKIKSTSLENSIHNGNCENSHGHNLLSTLIAPNMLRIPNSE